MRKMTGKKITKIIALALSAFMALSAPMTAYAVEPDATIPAVIRETSEDTMAPSEAAAIIDVAEDMIGAKADEKAETDATGCIGSIEDAKDAFAGDKMAAGVVADLQEGEDLLEKAEGELDSALTALKDSDVQTLDGVIKNLDEADKQIGIFYVDGGESYDNAGKAIDNAKVANSSDDEAAARAAKTNAESELKVAETDLISADAACDLADKAVKAADKSLTEKQDELERAIIKVGQINKDIENGVLDAKEAEAAVRSAQAKADELDERVTALSDNKAALEDLSRRYYNFMVHYYRDGAINSAVYETGLDENGRHKLDIEASAAKAVENGKDENPSFHQESNTLVAGRDLLGEIVNLKLLSEGATNIRIGYESDETKDVKQAATNTHVEDSPDNKHNERVKIDATEDIYFNYQKQDSGRCHYIMVSYVKPGETEPTVERYNYIFKASKYGDETDLQNGPIYVAKIEKNENGKWTATRDADSCNFDDYSKLQQALVAVGELQTTLDNYKVAQDKVAAALKDVEDLNKKLEELKKVDGDIATLTQRLEDAKKTLAQATQDKAVLEAKVEEARKAVASIDLSRFATTTSSDDDDDTTTTDTTPVAGQPAAGQPAAPAQGQGQAQQPAVQQPVDDNQTVIEDNDTAKAATPEVKDDIHRC
ncbi:MAG: hypothetical protein K6G57_09700 [Lachnospiraceae bacterium]|nr:hypothetical protein [Lachnospiraceae bacterium]